MRTQSWYDRMRSMGFAPMHGFGSKEEIWENYAIKLIIVDNLCDIICPSQNYERRTIYAFNILPVVSALLCGKIISH